MEPQKTANRREAFEQGLVRTGEAPYVLSLYVAGFTRRSTQAITNLKAICETHLQGRYELEVIDICQQPVLAREQEIVAVPTLIKRTPLPLCRLIGDMSNEERVLRGLDVRK